MRQAVLILAASLLPTVTWAQSGAALPSTCTAGDVFTFTGATPNLQVVCASTSPPIWVLWAPPPGGAGGDGAAWGDITGTLSAQTDLATALGGKAPTVHTHAYEPANANLQAHVASAHAPATAQKNSDITKAEIEAKLTGELSSHTHAAGGGTAWGGITGTLANQTDLQTVLTGKAATAHSHLDAEVANTITLDNLTQVTTRAIADTTGTLAVARGGTNLTAAADDNVLVGNATTWETKALPDCDTAATSKLLYDTTTNAFSCGTDQAAGGGPTTLISTGAPTDAVVATYTAIPGIAFTPAANTKYLIDCVIIYTTAAATTGISFAWDVPTAATIHMSGYTTTTAAGLNEGFWQRADNVGGFTSAGVITVQNTAILAARLENGANATSTTLGFTPEIATSSAVIAGSVCQYRSY